MKTLNTIGLIGGLLISSMISAAGKEPEMRFSATEVAPGLYVLMGVNGFSGGNIGLSIGECL